MQIASLIVAVISIIISFGALVCSLTDTRVMYEYWHSGQSVLVKAKDEDVKMPGSELHFEKYHTKNPLFGIVETGWYSATYTGSDNELTPEDVYIQCCTSYKDFSVVMITFRGKRRTKAMKKV